MTQNPQKTTLFSVITVTLNNIGGLKRTHISLESQGFRDFEWIIIDGASTDATLDYLSTTNALWTSAPDNGIYDAMNKGIDQATGTYLLFLNAGDTLIDSQVLEKIAACAAHHPDFIYGDSFEGPAYKIARKPDIRTGMFTHHQAMFYHRTHVAAMRYNTAYKIAADYEFTARFLNTNAKIAYCPMPICIFEPGGISQTQARLGRSEQYKIRQDLKLMPQPLNILLTTAQALLWQMRCRAPALYWRLKAKPA